ncbi:hypothetical protein C0995_015392 [Termitomyces sp. Mi166|nr:hypothetical protein C0995_015392 [Termitomyces sp. Mi166\
MRADSPVLGFDGVESDDPLRYPSPNFARDLCTTKECARMCARTHLLQPAPQTLSLHSRNAVYLDPDDASALFPRPVSVAASIDSYSENKMAALDHIRALYSSPSCVYIGPPVPRPDPPSSRWSTTSSQLNLSEPPAPKRKRLTSLFSRLSALTSSAPQAHPEPREMQKAYLDRDDPPIALDLCSKHSERSSPHTFYTCLSHPSSPTPEPYIDHPGVPPDLSLGALTFRPSTLPASPTPSLDSSPEPRRDRIKRQLEQRGLREQISIATFNSAIESCDEDGPDSAYAYGAYTSRGYTYAYSHSSFSLSTTTTTTPYTSPPLSPIAFPTTPATSVSFSPPTSQKEKRSRRNTGLKAFSIPAIFSFKSRSRARSLVSSPSPPPVPAKSPTPVVPPSPAKRITILLPGSAHPVTVVLPPAPRGPPPVPPKDARISASAWTRRVNCDSSSPHALAS